MSLHQEYIGKSIAFKRGPSTGKVTLVVSSGDLFPDPHLNYQSGHNVAEQRFEFQFGEDSEELATCLRQLAEIVQA
ncbi:hypothetical protein [Escherichia coli]|uniref:hypothetical protein n=1 Tax=Escherichia coli TaxID=562 RepID=UPI00191A7656|nr:hypothetical protein [Escherichia coli]CAD6036604.1 Uncharacterised protein [Escherichia coli]CAD6098681.1 Uncharacterised protein [Escherichia coli]CAD6176590.1 Uncharacterised protein [Escherichia coli]